MSPRLPFGARPFQGADWDGIGGRRWLLPGGLALLCVGASALAGFGKAPDSYRLLLGLGYLAVLAGIAGYDLETRRAPNRIVYPALGGALLASLPLGAESTIEAIVGGGGAFAALLVIALLGRGAMGLGDVKVGALCGVVVGLHVVPVLLVLTFGLGLSVSGPLVLFRVVRRKDTIAFTPFLGAGTALTLCFGHTYLWP